MSGASIVFLCFGNICRSPFAEHEWNRLIGRSGGPRAISAGFHETSGRPTPKEFIALAAEFGIDLSGHRSRVVTAELLSQAEAILLMDERNRRALSRLRPGLAPRARLLGSYAPDVPDEIADPWGKATELARGCYRDISRAVRALRECSFR